MDLEFLHPRREEELGHASVARSKPAYIGLEILPAARAGSSIQLIDTAGATAAA
jgi:hypothetical protein